MKAVRLPSSFRDPSGFVYSENSVIFRQVNHSYASDYDLLMKSGLYKSLVKKGLLIPHEETTAAKGAYKTLKPQHIPFISYPYEWSFSQLKDAALATLAIHIESMSHGMSLKDASAYNIQFLEGRPVFIDTLSFEAYKADSPWVAYRQFCQHFLAPLALVSQTDLHLGTLSQLHLDGIPLELASKLLRSKTRLSLGLNVHIHLHAKSQKNHSDPTADKQRAYRLPKNQLLALLSNLEATVRSLKMPKQKTVWDDYYDNTNYTPQGLHTKETLISDWIDSVKPVTVWDAGSNSGRFSRIASKKGILTVATDIDPAAVEQAYQAVKRDKDKNLLPLVLDLTNPTPAIGWAHDERQSFGERAQFELTFCLALVHHLAIANNLPLTHIASFFSDHTKHLIIEFVPKQDSNAKKLLVAREDIFPDYTQEGFEKAFSEFFSTAKKEAIPESSRVLYHMIRKDTA